MNALDEARCRHYVLLSRLFTDQAGLSDIEDCLAFAASIAGESANLLGQLVSEMEHIVEKPELERKLAVEYAHLFLLPEGVKPYESVYKGQEPLLMQQPWVEAKTFYQDCGWCLEHGAKHPEDHVSVELAFMAHLIENGSDREREEDFFRRHIAAWVPRLFQDILGNRYADFYRSVGEYGLSFLGTELIRIDHQ